MNAIWFSYLYLYLFVLVYKDQESCFQLAAIFCTDQFLSRVTNRAFK